MLAFPKEKSMAERESSAFGLMIFAVLLALIVGTITLSIMLPHRTDDAGAYRAVRALGFADARITARYGSQTSAWQHGCGEGEMSGCEMQATDPSGRTIRFLVCCGGAGGRSCSIRQPVDPE